MQDIDPSDEEFGLVSKSELKRQMTKLQKLGEELVNLSAADLAKIPMDEQLSEAIALAHKIRNKREGHRRQLQFIGKLMRTRDAKPLQEALDRVKGLDAQSKAAFHQLEQWRNQIVEQQDDAINTFIEKCPQADRQRLRQLARQARKEMEKQGAPKAKRELFKYLRYLSQES